MSFPYVFFEKRPLCLFKSVPYVFFNLVVHKQLSTIDAMEQARGVRGGRMDVFG